MNSLNFRPTSLSGQKQFLAHYVSPSFGNRRRDYILKMFCDVCRDLLLFEAVDTAQLWLTRSTHIHLIHLCHLPGGMFPKSLVLKKHPFGKEPLIFGKEAGSDKPSVCHSQSVPICSRLPSGARGDI